MYRPRGDYKIAQIPQIEHRQKRRNEIALEFPDLQSYNKKRMEPMNKFSRLLAFVSLIALLVTTFANVQPAASKPAQQPDKSKRVPDIIILEVQEGVNLEEDEKGNPNHKFKTNSPELDAALSALGVHGLKPLFSPGQAKKAEEDSGNVVSLTRIYRLKLKPNTDIDAAVAALSAVPGVIYAEPDYIAEASDTQVFAPQSSAALSASQQVTSNGNPAFLTTKCLDAEGLKQQKDPHNGKLHFVGAKSGKPMQHPDKSSTNGTPEEAARGYLKQCGSLFGVQDEAIELNTKRMKELDQGRSEARFQQNVNGIPVLGGEIILQMDADKNIMAIVSELTDATLINTTPSIDGDSAIQAALDLVAKKNNLEISALSASTPELWFYDPTIFEIETGQTPALVWRLEVRATDKPINELVLVDAQTKTILLHFNQIDASWVSTGESFPTQITSPVSSNAPAYALGAPLISIYTMNHSNVYGNLPGTLMCNQGNPALCNGDADGQAAYQYALDTYNFYANKHGRDSIDGLGMGSISSVHFGSGYQNAFWNGSQITYGDGFVADDVVALEQNRGARFTDGSQ
jgi:hypothetical protein